MTRASSVRFGVVVFGALILVPVLQSISMSQGTHGEEESAQDERREPEEEWERLRAAQLDGLQEAVWYVTRLLWAILLALAALILGMMLKSTEIKKSKPFDPKRDRKRPKVIDVNDLES